MAGAALIGVDWGTTSFRAFLLDAGGAVLDRRESAQGILKVEDGDFAFVLAAETAIWLRAACVPVLMSGMIGSRQGWVETPYRNVPAGVSDLASALVEVPFEAADVRLVPGLKDDTGPMPDVLRGEEVQVLGAMARLGIESGCFVLPGTHSKWVSVESGRITGFATYMTGETYDAMRRHTILGRLMGEGDGAREAFDEGVREGARHGTPGALLNRLFGVRTAGLFDRFAPADLPEYLSGLLIGAEIADQKGKDVRGLVHIIASSTLTERYRVAAETLGVTTHTAPEDCVADGHMAIARLAGLV
jgi:2-dehydro-3-deoxygalactonokinase